MELLWILLIFAVAVLGLIIVISILLRKYRFHTKTSPQNTSKKTKTNSPRDKDCIHVTSIDSYKNESQVNILILFPFFLNSNYNLILKRVIWDSYISLFDVANRTTATTVTTSVNLQNKEYLFMGMKSTLYSYCNGIILFCWNEMKAVKYLQRWVCLEVLDTTI